ncbi:hypothetical protein [uncultured Deinococcus sp.]|uniref:hypothetical protein n=1 Tax=uncultured Deinococcus sp. TaxID=158789 RepID=UPI0025D5A1AD|nr:hypothetical protein [uncultured Deinococcus sp.]
MSLSFVSAVHHPAMLPSELARDLSIDQSVLSKILNRYYQISGGHRPRTLPPEVVAHIREVRRRVETGEATSMPQAVEMVLGTYVAPIPPASAREVMQSMAAVQTRLDEALTRLERIETTLIGIEAYVERSRAQRAARMTTDGTDAAS